MSVKLTAETGNRSIVEITELENVAVDIKMNNGAEYRISIDWIDPDGMPILPIISVNSSVYIPSIGGGLILMSPKMHPDEMVVDMQAYKLRLVRLDWDKVIGRK